MDDLQFLPRIGVKSIVDLKSGTIGILKCCCFISTLISSECTRFLDKFQQYRHNVCRAPATEIAPSPLLGEVREGCHVQGDKSMPAAELDRVDCVGKLFGFWSGGDGRPFRYRTG